MDLFNQTVILEEATRDLVRRTETLFAELNSLDLSARVYAINEIRKALHKFSPFFSEPVDCVQWIPSELIQANDYNPNSVAPPEMKLLELSICEDGYTQPIVAWANGTSYEVVDGFHRNRVGKESSLLRARIHGYLPVTVVNDSRLDRGDRIAATIRHNRARGKHRVEAMSDIVIELKRRNWTDEKIGKNLGMDPDEILRLTQITGLAEMFANQDFSKAWDIETDNSVGSEILSDEITGEQTSDRLLHTWDKWECYKAGFYEEKPAGMTQQEGEEKYREFLADLPRFEAALDHVTSQWHHSCEHYLSNERMNRIAWLGQAAVAHALHIPSCCRAGYHALSENEKRDADLLALRYLNKWREGRGLPALELSEAASKTEMDLY